MNDLFIITVCIFLLILTWSIYFKKFFKEGNDPAQANYTMPISFSGEGNNKIINIPPNITTNGKKLILDPDTTIVGETKLNQSLTLDRQKFITFGDGTAISTNNKWGRDNRNELEIVGVGNCDRGCNRFIHMWDDVQVERNLKVYNDVNSNSINTGSSNVAGNSTTKSLGVADSTATGSLVVGGNTKTSSLNVNDNTTTGSLNVNGHSITNSLNVNAHTKTDSLNTNHLKIGKDNSPNIKGIRIGWVAGNRGRVDFNPPFSGKFVVVTTTKSNREWDTLDGWEWYITIQVYNVSNSGFNFAQRCAHAVSGYGFAPGTPAFGFNWIAVCADDAQFN